MTKRISIVLVLALSPTSLSLAAEDTWTKKTDMPTRRWVLSSSVVGGKIYAIGGDPGSGAFSIVEAYDPATDTWTRKANMPMVRAAGTSNVVNGRIYVVGGRPSLHGANISSVQEYDATTDTWKAKANMLTARSWLSSSVVDGKIYAIGGARAYQGTSLSTVEEYDPANDTWTRKADMPTPRASVSTSSVNGKIYAIGGALRSPWNQGVSTVEEYNPATDTWTRKADMPGARTYFSTCAVNGKIYAIGGLKGQANHLSPVEEYDPATDTWTRRADMPSARSGLATSAVNGKIYAIGGWVGSGTPLSTVEEYAPYPLVVDLNGDGMVDAADMCIMVDYWGTDEPLCDIGPMPWGDGVVDVQDLIVLAAHLFEESGLVAHWKLDETEGDMAYDSAAENDATVMGDAIWQPDSGMVGGALQFDGVDDYIGADPVLDPGDGAFSVFAWIKGGAPGQVIISQEEENSKNWLFVDAIDGCMKTGLGGSDRRPDPLNSHTVVTDGLWHRVGLIWDGTNRLLYIDDVEVASDQPLSPKSASGDLCIGAGKDLTEGSFWSGMIDDVRIYDRVVAP